MERAPQTKLPAELLPPTDEAEDLNACLFHAQIEAWRELTRYCKQPDTTNLWRIMDALRAYEAAWEDWQQERSRG